MSIHLRSSSSELSNKIWICEKSNLPPFDSEGDLKLDLNFISIGSCKFLLYCFSDGFIPKKLYLQ